ncbi:MAG: hypothetical protein ACOX4R_07030 [Lentihominibacter sp.]
MENRKNLIPIRNLGARKTHLAIALGIEIYMKGMNHTASFL